MLRSHKMKIELSFSFFFSEKLGVPTETVQHGVEGLIYLLTESSKLLVCIFIVFIVSL